MPTMRRNGEALVATVLVLAAMAPPARAVGAFGSACQKDTDCDTGLCNVYFTDSTYTLNSFQSAMGFGKDGIANLPLPSVKRGICVECKTECDCDVNQYCASDQKLVIPNGVKSENAGTGATAYAKKIMEAYGMAFSGMILRGKCKSLGSVESPWMTWPIPTRPEYDVPNRGGLKCLNPLSVSNTFQLEHEETVDEVMHTNAKFTYAAHGVATTAASITAAYDVPTVGLRTDVTVKSVRKPRSFPTGKLGLAEPAGTAGQFCGLIAQYAPAFYATATGGLKFKTVDNADRPANSEYLSTGNYFNTPAACPTWVNSTRTTCNRCYDCDSARDPCAWSKADYKVYPEGWGEMKVSDPKKNRDTKDIYRVVQGPAGSNDLSTGFSHTNVNGAPTGMLSSGVAATAATDTIDGLAWEEDFQRGRGLDYQPWGTFYLSTEYETSDPLLEADGTTNNARNGVTETPSATVGKGLKGFTVNTMRDNNARREGVTRDMCEECSVLCNRYTMREEADYGIFQYDNMLDFDDNYVYDSTNPDNSKGFNPYLYAKYPFGQDSPFEQYAEDCFLNPYTEAGEGNPSTEAYNAQACAMKPTTAAKGLLSWHATVTGVQAEVSKIKNRELFTGKHASSYMAGSKVKQVSWTRHSDYKLCMMKCYTDQRYDAWAGGAAWSADKDKDTDMRSTFDMCANKEVDIVIGPGGYQSNRQFYPLKLNSTYDVREYGIAMMEEREGAPLGCNDGVSTSNSFQTHVTNPDGSLSIASTDAVFNVGGFYFHSPIIEWQGYCEYGKCYRCKEGSTRCSGEKGIAQTCHEGVWMRSDYLRPDHDQSYKYHPATKLLGAICIFLIIIILLLLIAIIIYCCCNRQEYIPVQKPMPIDMTPPPVSFMAPAPPPLVQSVPMSVMPGPHVTYEPPRIAYSPPPVTYSPVPGYSEPYLGSVAPMRP